MVVESKALESDGIWVPTAALPLSGCVVLYKVEQGQSEKPPDVYLG